VREALYVADGETEKHKDHQMTSRQKEKTFQEQKQGENQWFLKSRAGTKGFFQLFLGVKCTEVDVAVKLDTDGVTKITHKNIRHALGTHFFMDNNIQVQK